MLPTVTRAGMPCCARAWRRAPGSSLYCLPLRRVSVLVPPGPLTTVKAASCALGGVAGGEVLPEEVMPVRPRVTATPAAAPAPASPDSRRRRRERPLATIASTGTSMWTPDTESRIFHSTSLSFIGVLPLRSQACSREAGRGGAQPPPATGER